MTNRKLKYQWIEFVEYMKIPASVYLAILPFATIIAARGLFVVPIILTMALIVIAFFGVIHSSLAAQAKMSEENQTLMQGIKGKK